MTKTLGCDPRTFDTFYRSPLLGIDEVGTGALAGPICVGGVVLPQEPDLLDALVRMGLRDSKLMTSATRKNVSDFIKEQKIWYVVAFAGPRTIEDLGHTQTLDHLFNEVMWAFRDEFGVKGSILLDGYGRKELRFTHTGVVKGDKKSLSIQAGASMAKVARDERMVELSEMFPGYGIHDNVGYGTRTHLDGLAKYGACSLHRKNVKRIRDLVRDESPPVDVG
jgi:ribonuclease HII